MPDETMQKEYDGLILLCGTAMLQRVNYLNQEIRRQQFEEMEAKKKAEQVKTPAPTTEEKK